MFRILGVILLILVLCVAATAANVTVTYNGKTVSVPAIESKGKVFIDAVAFAKLFGVNAVYNAAAHKVTVGAAVANGVKAQTKLGSRGSGPLPGGDGKYGDIFTIVKSDPLYFSLKSAEFTTDQVKIGERIYAPKSNEKLLVLNFTVQNPDKSSDHLVRWDSLRFIAVDAMNVNHDESNDWGDAINKNRVEMALKPSQTVAVYTVITVPAKGVVPKLMVQPPSENDGPVIRYDLHDQVAPLKGPVADPSDSTGATALETVPGKLGEAYPYSDFDITVEKCAYTTSELNGSSPDEGGRFFVVTLLTKNESPSEQLLRWDTFSPTVISSDGEEFQYGGMLLATANRTIERGVKLGEEVRVRMYFSVPEGASAKTLRLKEDEGRTYEFNVE